MSILSLHHLTMIHAHPLDLIEAAAAGGFSHCGIRLVAPRPGDPIVDVVSNHSERSAIARRLADTGIGLLDIEAVWISPTTDIESLRAPLEMGAALGAKYVLVVANDDDRGRLADNFAAICGLAQQLGLKVMLEFITYCSVSSLGEAVTFINEAAQPNAGVLIDALQFYRAGGVATQIAAYDQELFSYVQICDGQAEAPRSAEERRAEARGNRRLPGHGELALADLLRALPAHLPYSLEAPTPELAGLDYREQGRIAGEVTRAFLARCGLT